jgi:tetratricopeptide (TPR) repeat protein
MNDDALMLHDGRWNRISGLFEAVLSMPSPERAAFLDASCGSDAALRAELESLVSAHDGAPQFLDAFYTDVIHPALAHGVPDTEQAAALATPYAAPATRIRHFTVHERLGSGGAGVVYRGWDTLLERDVAIKFLAPTLSQDPTARLRLVREARAASRLEDPHVCAIHAIESTDDGGLCIVMGYCAGGTLRERLRLGPLPTADVRVIALHMARGLACAHRAGIVHGDIKPANVGFGDGNVARLLDFGVAVHARDAAHTVRGLSGTMPYLAPELWRGGTHDARTDVWALGVTFFEMVTGERPFTAADPFALTDAILAASVPPIVRPDGSTLAPELEQLIRRMLSADAGARPADGSAVLADLTVLPHSSDSQSVSHAPVGDVARTIFAPATRRRGRIAAAFGAATLAFSAWALVTSSSRRVAPPTAVEVARTARPLPTVAVLPFTTRGGKEIAYLADGMVDLLTPAFDGTGLVRGIDPNTVVSAARDHGSNTIDSATAQALALKIRADRYVVGSVVGRGETLTLRATLRRVDGREVGRAQATVSDSNGLASGVDALVRQLIATELSAPGDTIAGIAAATTTSTRALRAYLDGERELRDARPAAAVAKFQSAVSADSSFALAWYRLARAARWSDVDSLSMAAARRAFELASSLPPHQQALVRAYHTLRFGSPKSAEQQFTQLVADYPTDVDAWMLLGELQFGSNAFYGRPLNDAAAAFQRVMALDPRNREVTVYLMDLAAHANRLGQLDTLFTMYFSPNSAGEQPGIRATYTALHKRRLSGAAQRRRDPDALMDPALARVALHRISTDIRDRAAARAYAQSVATAPESRADGLLALGALDVADGDWDAAELSFQQAALLAPDASAEQRALFALSPSVRVSPDTLRALRRALLARSTGQSAPHDDLTRNEHDDVRQYLFGLLSVRLGDSTGMLAARAALTRRAANTSRVAASLSAAVEGHWLLRAGNLSDALVAFERCIPELPARLRAQSPALAQHLDRLAHAETLRRLNRPDDAARWYRSLREGAGVAGTPFVAAADSALRTLAGR